jgi:hypothetical protein
MVVNLAMAPSITVVMVQTSVSMLSAPPTTGGAALEKVAPTKGSASLGTNAGSSRALVHVGGDLHAWGGPALRWADRRNLEATLFALDDAVEVGDWARIDTGVELAVHALNIALGSLCDVVDLIG